MNFFKKLLIRLRISSITAADVHRGTIEKDADLLRLALRFGHFKDRAAAAAAVGRLHLKEAIPDLLRLLWDDFESVAGAAHRSLQPFLPNAEIERELARAETFRVQREAQRSLKRETIWYTKNNPLEAPSPLVDRSKMRMLAKVKIMLQKPIRFW